MKRVTNPVLNRIRRTLLSAGVGAGLSAGLGIVLLATAPVETRAADLTPLRLAFLPTAETVPVGVLQMEDIHRFDGVLAPAGEPNLYRNALGMTNPGSTALSAALGFAPGFQANLFWESRMQTAGAEVRQVLMRFGARAPLLLGASVNAQKRFDAKGSESGSTGGSATLERAGSTWRLQASFAGQTGTLADTGSTGDHSTLAWGLGIQRRGEVVRFYAESVFPLQGHRTYYGRKPDGLPLLAAGLGFPVWHGALDLLISNTASVAIGNILAGPGDPSAHRSMEAHLGMSYRYAFGLWGAGSPANR